MADKNGAFRLHVTVHPDKHPAAYEALKCIDRRARSSRLMLIAESSLDRPGTPRSTAPGPSPSPGTVDGPSPVDDLGSLLVFTGGTV